MNSRIPHHSSSNQSVGSKKSLKVNMSCKFLFIGSAMIFITACTTQKQTKSVDVDQVIGYSTADQVQVEIAAPSRVSAKSTVQSQRTAIMVSPAPQQHSGNGSPNPFSSLSGGARVSLPRESERLIKSDTEKYQNNEVNPVKSVAQEPVSTFSIDVDTGSYANVRRYLNDEGQLPPVDAVRIEELVNYFNYHYSQIKTEHPFTVNTETVDSPWQQNAKLIRIGIKANDIEYKKLPPANLVFLVDVSGSMDEENKLPLVKKTLRILTEQLRAQDKVTIVTYSSGEQLVLPPTSGSEKKQILKVINQLQAGGATSGQRAIEMAYAEAQKSFMKEGINRILIATDGDFNVGVSNTDTLKGMISEKRKSGISFTTLGYGAGNYNEELMEQLADAGDGNYSYIDNEKEAKKVVQRQISSTLATVAQDVKIQMEFNPATVKEYRLIGYENRMLKQEDFNNDKVDAGDIGAGHTVTAIYEIIPVGQKGWLSDSRYTSVAKQSDTNSNEYGYLNLRYKQPGQSKSVLLSQPVQKTSKPLSQASEDTRFAVAVAAYGQQLKGGQYNGKMTWDEIIQLAKKSSNTDEFGLKSEFLDFLQTAKSLTSPK